MAIIFFVATTVVVIGLMMVVNYQVDEHFTIYLHMSEMHGMMMHRNDMVSMMGGPENQFLASLKQSLLVAGGAMLLIGGIVSYYLARSIALPVIDLNRAVNKVAEGDLNTAVTVEREDEVGQLQQRFLAGVAHELRTPLTILKANLEGITDGIIVADQE